MAATAMSIIRLTSAAPPMASRQTYFFPQETQASRARDVRAWRRYSISMRSARDGSPAVSDIWIQAANA